MPYTTYANQKSIRIHKSSVSRDFLQIPNADWMAINKQLGPYGLQLYLYLAANADGYNLSLSPQNAENDAGIRRTTFYEYMRKLEINGYLVWRHTNTYDFYTTARPADERSHPDKHQEGINFEKNPPCESTVSCESAAQKQNPPDETVNPSTVQDCSHGNIVIDNIYDKYTPQIMGTYIRGKRAKARFPLQKKESSGFQYQRVGQWDAEAADTKNVGQC